MRASLETILAAKIKSVDAYVSIAFTGCPVIQLCSVTLEDGRKYHIEGEHDCAYIPIDADTMAEEPLAAACEPDEQAELHEHFI